MRANARLGMFAALSLLAAAFGAVLSLAPGHAQPLPGYEQVPDRYYPFKDPTLQRLAVENPQIIAPRNAPAQARIASAGEPGERLIVSGQITDGTKPIAGASIYVHQADAKGDPSRQCTGCPHPHSPRLHAVMRTDAQGRYRFETIRPGRMSEETAAQLEFIMTTGDYIGWKFALAFADDPVVIEQQSRPRGPIRCAYDLSRDCGTFAHRSVRLATKDAKGVWHVTQDLVLADTRN